MGVMMAVSVIKLRLLFTYISQRAAREETMRSRTVEHTLPDAVTFRFHTKCGAR